MGIQIRLMQAADYAGAIQLWQGPARIGPFQRRTREEAIQAFLLRNPNTCFVAAQDDQIVGTVLGGSDGRRGYLYHLARAR